MDKWQAINEGRNYFKSKRALGYAPLYYLPPGGQFFFR